MTTIMLIRHAMTDAAGTRLAGTTPGTHLNREGVDQARALARRLQDVPIQAIYTSPLERAVETAAPLALARGLDIVECRGFLELNFGSWTGADFSSLSDDPRWRRFNTYRSGTSIPGGESMLGVQARAVDELIGLCVRHDNERIAVFTHADVIRALLSHYAAIPLDLCLRIQVDPCSISVLAAGADAPVILAINDTGHIA
jgi:probable phosphomutase (TIGR03848 family)